MTADTPTSVATINHLLLGAPYTSPLVIPGDWLVDELEGAVEVGGFTDGLFRWPTRKRSGRPSPILCGDLLRAVRTECAESVQFWWGFSPSLVGRWRRALGVTRRNNPGDQAVARARAALARSLDRKAPPKAPAAWSSEEVEFIRPLHCINLRTSAEVQESLQVLATQGLFLSLMFCRGPLRSAYSRDF